MSRVATKVASVFSATRSTWRCLAFVLVVACVLPPWTAAADGTKEPAGRDTPAVQSEAKIESGVFYATNRRRSKDESAANFFSGERGERQYGVCRVEFSPIPIVDRFGSKVSFYVPKETNRISNVEHAEPRLFWDDLVTTAQQASSRSVILFVHGYNYGFKRTCRMAAEMQRAMLGKATVVMISWPSNGRPTDYLPDQVDLEWSVPFLASVLAKMGERVGPANLHVLAHSMGSRGVLFALTRLRADLAARPLINRLVLLAPDFDSQTFVDLAPSLDSLANHITLYASSNDAPLKLSRQLNGNPRLGEAGKYLTVVEGVETIDVSPVGRYQILGHEYFYFHPKVTADLVVLLSSGKSAGERKTLRSRTRDGTPYWEIVKDATP